MEEADWAKKKKLGVKLLQYNTIAPASKTVITEAVCSLSEDVILPWEAQDGEQKEFGSKCQRETKQAWFLAWPG